MRKVNLVKSVIGLVVYFMLFAAMDVVNADGETDGISTYKSTEYVSAGSVFGDGEDVYVMVMDWVQNQGGSSTATVGNGTESISVNIYDNGTSPDSKANDGHYWGVFTVGTGATNDAADYLYLADGNEATITADIGSDGSSETGTILAYYNTNPTKITASAGDSIQTAINNLPAEGGIVELATGTHNVSSTITISKNNIVLQGTTGAVLNHTNSSSYAFQIENCQNITIRDLSTTSSYTFSPVLLVLSLCLL